MDKNGRQTPKEVPSSRAARPREYATFSFTIEMTVYSNFYTSHTHSAGTIWMARYGRRSLVHIPQVYKYIEKLYSQSVRPSSKYSTSVRQ
jgi:hypothetical protein